MRRPGTALSLLLALSICLAALAPVALAENAAPPSGDRPPDSGRIVITWTPPSLTAPVAPGESETVQVTFSSTMAIERAVFMVGFPLSRYVQVMTPTPFAVVAGQSYTVDLAVSLPETTADSPVFPGVAGTIHVAGQMGPLYQAPLLLMVKPAASLPPLQWTPERVRLSTDPSGTLPSTIDVQFTTNVAISGARVRATAPLDRVLDLSQTGPMDLQPGVVYRLRLTAHLPAAALGESELEGEVDGKLDSKLDGKVAEISDAPRPPVRRLLSGMVQVYTPLRVYQKMLPVTVVLVPTPVTPVVSWQPPVVNLRVLTGASERRVVAATSNLLVANPTLAVLGEIAPYVSAAFESADPAAMQPNTPYRVVLNVTAPATALVNRPLSGQVVVIDGNNNRLRHELKVTLIWQRPRPTPTPTP